jgi:ribosomal protein L29
MVKKSAEKNSELEAARLEAMRIRFRKVMGESVAAHIVRAARKNIANCVRALKKGEEKNA